MERMMSVGEVVKIEPIPNSAVPLPRPARFLKSEKAREDRLKIAARIVELSNQVLSTKENAHYIALKIGSGPNSNTVNVWKSHDRVGFFIRSSDLLRKAEAEGFKPEPAKRQLDRYRFWELSLRDIEAHEPLFREIVKESVGVIMDRRPKRK